MHVLLVMDGIRSKTLIFDISEGLLHLRLIASCIYKDKISDILLLIRWQLDSLSETVQ
jgi:hypothetical protein